MHEASDHMAFYYSTFESDLHNSAACAAYPPPLIAVLDLSLAE